MFLKAVLCGSRNIWQCCPLIHWVIRPYCTVAVLKGVLVRGYCNFHCKCHGKGKEQPWYSEPYASCSGRFIYCMCRCVCMNVCTPAVLGLSCGPVSHMKAHGILLGGHGDLVSRLTPVSHMVTPAIPIINLLTQSP